MVTEYDRAKRMLEKYPSDPDVAYFARKYARKAARQNEMGVLLNTVIKEVIDAWTASGFPAPTPDPKANRYLAMLIEQHGVEAVTQRLVAGITSQSPSFLWKDGCPALSTFFGQYDAIPTHQMMMSPGQLFGGGCD